jgi:hypothetical protein
MLPVLVVSQMEPLCATETWRTLPYTTVAGVVCAALGNTVISKNRHVNHRN